ILAIIFFVFAVYLFTGIFGNNLWAINAMIPPKSEQSFNIGSTTVVSVDQEDTENYCGPGKYSEMFEFPYGIKGYFNYEDGVNCAIAKNKPIFLDFTGHTCSNCKQMESQVWSDPEVQKRLKEDYVIISLYTDDKTKLPEDQWVTRTDGKVLKTIGEINKYFEIDHFGTIATPLYVLTDAKGNLLTEPKTKDLNVESYLEFLDKGLENFDAESAK
ncbi:MAG TPA: thioredoxin family protein, partial [Bacteroidales bacterium]|nr:thioredoxin family protein [Bacteroidales bacterium]